MSRQLYSYIRWSSDKQTAGSSHDRQSSTAQQIAEQYDLEIVELLDAGVSAFRGSNRKLNSALGGFISAVKAGAIASDSWLLVENLDRLTREDVITANRMFLELLDLGLTIITGMDQKIFTKDSVNKNPTDLMLSILLFMRANEESKTKQSRTKGAVLSLVERHKSGLPVNIKAAGSHPWWIDDTGPKDEAVKPHPVFFAVAKEIVGLYLQGWGTYKVAEYLNRRYTPPAPYKSKKSNHQHWNINALRRFRHNRALIGERELTLLGSKYTLQNYYPVLCTEAEYYQMQHYMESNRQNVHSKTETISLLSGMKKLYCGCCGGSMSFMTHRGKIRYICEAGRSKSSACDAWSVVGSVVERSVITAIIIAGYTSTTARVANQIDYTSIISDKQNQLNDIQTKIDNLTAALAIKMLPSIVENLDALENQKITLMQDIEKLKTSSTASTASAGDATQQLMHWLDSLALNDIVDDCTTDKRHDLRMLLHKTLTKCTVTKRDDRGLEIRVLFNDVQVDFIATADGYCITVHDVIYPTDTLTDTVTEQLRDMGTQLHALREQQISAVQTMLATHGFDMPDKKMFWPNR